MMPPTPTRHRPEPDPTADPTPTRTLTRQAPTIKRMLADSRTTTDPAAARAKALLGHHAPRPAAWDLLVAGCGVYGQVYGLGFLMGAGVGDDMPAIQAGLWEAMGWG